LGPLKGYLEKAVDLTQFCDHSSRQPYIVVADQGEVAAKILICGTETDEFVVLNVCSVAKAIPLGDKVLDCGGSGNGHTFDCLVGLSSR
jgi:hypothetical protein